MSPNHILDHVVVSVRDLDQAVQDYRDLGFTVLRGGTHANGATHNALICFANGTYIELLAPTGSAPSPGLIDFSVLLQRGEGLTGFALGTADLEADMVRLKTNGIAAGPIVPGERRRGDGTLIRWELAQIEDDFVPFLIQDLTPRTLRVPVTPDATTHANHAGGLHGIRIRVGIRSLAAVTTRCARIVGVEPRQSYGYQAIDLKTGRIILMETPNQPGSAEALYAVEILGDWFSPDMADKMHGVRFVSYPTAADDRSG